MAFYPDLPSALRGLRRDSGLTQAQAASRLGVSKRTWQDWERGITAADKHMKAIEEAFELPAGWFAAHLNVLDRMLALEGRVEQLLALGRENQELLRDILGAIRVLGSSD